LKSGFQAAHALRDEPAGGVVETSTSKIRAFSRISRMAAVAICQAWLLIPSTIRTRSFLRRQTAPKRKPAENFNVEIVKLRRSMAVGPPRQCRSVVSLEQSDQ